MLNPVIPDESEIVKYEPHKVFPVNAELSETSSVVGLPCEFCNRYCKTVGKAKDEVLQVQVTPTGFEYKRWGGGELVWRCGRCESLKRTVTLKGMIVVPGKIPENNPEDVKKMVGDRVFSEVNGKKW